MSELPLVSSAVMHGIQTISLSRVKISQCIIVQLTLITTNHVPLHKPPEMHIIFFNNMTIQPSFRLTEEGGYHECVGDARWSGGQRKDMFSLSVPSHLQPRESEISVETHLHKVISHITLDNLDRFESYIFFTSSFRAPKIGFISRTLHQSQLDTTHQSNHNYTIKYSVILIIIDIIKFA
ncbi:unnamed protein product [Macrosiphum euphorbiae]|uniref:Uncharacterized protein n=1 Tax=Macrosiphum euphorbiae TaxID=13131 RepID=A0AAV0VJZ6_9HEMI|nr:unnamed protein product [Macrosiphum euphorbiae]